ncbi:MAG: chromosomal replication initiator protein DnaA [bacterium]
MEQIEPQFEPSSQNLWDEILHMVSKDIPQQSFHTWFKSLELVSATDEEICIGAPSRFFVEWIQSHYRDILKNAVAAASGHPVKVNFQILEGKRKSSSSQENPFPAVKVMDKPPIPKGDGLFIAGSVNLVPHLTFDNFVEGDSNRFARAASLACAEKPGRTSFNPLLIYGGAGLGKTHLLQAIGNFIIGNSNFKVIYVTSEQFTNDFIKAIEQRKREAFTRLYRSADVLLLDDVQFLMTKEKTQEEFFHTFNTFHSSGRQLVFSSDRPPKELDGFDSRLVSRLQWGLVTEIAKPEYETRVAIIKKRSAMEGVEVPEDVAHFIAFNITDNIRTLQGALIHLFAQASLMGKAITLELAKRSLKDFIFKQESYISPDRILEIVGRELNVSKEEVKSRSRRKEIAEARHIAIYLCTEYTKLTLKAIGSFFGDRDHATIIHARESIAQRAKDDPTLGELLDRMKRLVEISSV